MNYREIDISAWRQVGEGGNGKVFDNPSEPGVILKVNKKGLDTLEFAQKEYNVSTAVRKLGLSVPEAKEIVRVGDSFGTITEKILHKKSLSRICHDDPSRIEEMAEFLCARGKDLFATPCDKSLFPSRREQLMKSLGKVRFVSKKNIEILRAFAETIEEADTCIHGDFNMGNLVLAADRSFWIDLDRFGYGNPMFDIGHLFQICNTYASMRQVHDIFHLGEDQLHRFWDAFAKAYTGKEDHSEFDRLAGKFAAMDMVLCYEFHKDNLAEQIFFGVIIKRLIKKFYV